MAETGVTQRRLYLVSYDIADEKRLRELHARVKAYASGGQKSVFECWLNRQERRRLMAAAHAVVKRGEDRFFLLRLNPRQQAKLLGMAAAPSDPGFFYQG